MLLTPLVWHGKLASWQGERASGKAFSSHHAPAPADGLVVEREGTANLPAFSVLTRRTFLV